MLACNSMLHTIIRATDEWTRWGMEYPSLELIHGGATLRAYIVPVSHQVPLKSTPSFIKCVLQNTLLRYSTESPKSRDNSISAHSSTLYVSLKKPMNLLLLANQLYNLQQVGFITAGCLWVSHWANSLSVVLLAVGTWHTVQYHTVQSSSAWYCTVL